jgi:DNA/RNA-binding domain of Phe-tRNA-synthetase-like protein
VADVKFRLAAAAPFDTTREGLPVVEHPEPGEVIWRDDAGVTCRRWNWRQCTRTRITDSTVSAAFILDGLAVLGETGLMSAGRELAEYLTALHPSVRLTWRRLGPAPTSAAAGAPR